MLHVRNPFNREVGGACLFRLFSVFSDPRCNFDSRLDGGQQLKVSAIATPSFCIFTRGVGHKTELPL